MNAHRVSIARPGASAAELLALARWAEKWNVSGLWLGDPARRDVGGTTASDDSYLTAAAAGIAAVTRDLRLGLLLRLRGERHPLRLAEDLGVVDQMSSGRIELGLVPPAENDDRWRERVTSMLSAWDGAPVPDREEQIHVLPAPAQPVIPRLVVDEPALAEAWGGGTIQLTAVRSQGAPTPNRSVLVMPVEPGQGGVLGWLEADVVGRIDELRTRAAETGANEIMLTFAGALTENDVQALGSVVLAGVRANTHDFKAITVDGWSWLTEKMPLHARPA